MASWTRRTRFRLSIAAFVLLLLGVTAVLLPRSAILNERAMRADVVARLSAWTGGKIRLSGPMSLRYFPRITVSAQGFELESAPNIPHLRGISAREMRAEISLWSLLSQRNAVKRVILIEPKIALDVNLPDRAPEAGDAALAAAVRAAPFPAIKLANGEVAISGPHTSEKLTGVTVRTRMDTSQGALTVKGEFAWRQQASEFSFSAAAPTKDKSAKSPVSFRFRNPLVTAHMEGEGTLADMRRAAGSLDLEVRDLRKFARWLGLLIPDGPGLRRFEASGAFQLNGYRIGFSEGTFSLDGNKALGTLSAEFGAPRPKIAGTLAFSTIDLAKYRKTGNADLRRKTRAGAVKKKQLQVNFPLLHHLDFDLRLSTGVMSAVPFALGQVAVSVVVNSGRLVADFAILDLCAGHASGRLGFDAAVPETEIRLTSNVTGLAVEKCLDALGADQVVSGPLDLSIDLTSKGRTSDEILRQLGGKVVVEGGPGEIGLNLAPFATGTLPAKITGWQPLRSGVSPFGEAEAELIFRQGRIYSDRLKLVSDDTLFAGEGWIDLNTGSLDISLNAGKIPEQPKTGEAPPLRPPANYFVVKGPWSRPIFTVRKSVGGPVSDTAGATAATAQ